MGYLPSKNFIALVSGALVVIFAGWFSVWVWNTPASQSQTSNPKSQISFLAAYENASRDSDNDGLKDWEEILWKTDIAKADTDGDGATDGEEIKASRNPVKAGPDDKLPKPEEPAKSASKETTETLSDKIAGEFAAKYLTALGASQNSGGLSAFQQKAIAEALIGAVAGGSLGFNDKFSAADISIKENSDEAFVKSYLNAAGGFLDKNFLGLNDPEITILDRAVASSNFKELETLENYAEAYQRAVEFFKKQKVPSGYAAIHVEMMNILNNTSAAVSQMQATEIDPAKGLLGLSLYFKQAERVPAFSKSIQSKIKSDGINFAPSDGGYHFLRYKR